MAKHIDSLYVGVLLRGAERINREAAEIRTIVSMFQPLFSVLSEKTNPEIGSVPLLREVTDGNGNKVHLSSSNRRWYLYFSVENHGALLAEGRNHEYHFYPPNAASTSRVRGLLPALVEKLIETYPEAQAVHDLFFAAAE